MWFRCRLSVMYRLFEHLLELKVKDNIVQVKDCELTYFMKVY